MDESEEKITSQPDLLLVDLVSAAAVGDRVRGPGLWFTKKGEKVRGTVDLRKQVRKRENIQGCTRDGIKVQTAVWVTFTLQEDPEILYAAAPPGYPEDIQLVDLTGDKKIKGFTDALDDEDKKEILSFIKTYPRARPSSRPRPRGQARKSPLIFSIIPEHVLDAVNSRLKDDDDKEVQVTDWDGYPAYITTAKFRDRLVHENFDALLLPDDTENYPLKDFRQEFSRLVQCQGIISVKYVKRRDGTPIRAGQSWLDQELFFYPVRTLRRDTDLRRRGIKVISAGFSELRPGDAVRDQMYQHWRAKWKQQETETQADHELKAMRILNRARVRAQRDMVHAISQVFQRSSHSREALAIRVLEALEAAVADPAKRELLSNEALALLDHLQLWLLHEPDDLVKTP